MIDRETQNSESMVGKSGAKKKAKTPPKKKRTPSTVSQGTQTEEGLDDIAPAACFGTGLGEAVAEAADSAGNVIQGAAATVSNVLPSFSRPESARPQSKVVKAAQPKATQIGPVYRSTIIDRKFAAIPHMSKRRADHQLPPLKAYVAPPEQKPIVSNKAQPASKPPSSAASKKVAASAMTNKRKSPLKIKHVSPEKKTKK